MQMMGLNMTFVSRKMSSSIEHSLGPGGERGGRGGGTGGISSCTVQSDNWAGLILR